jgi:hypothetical protein
MEMPDETKLNENGISIVHLMLLHQTASLTNKPAILNMIMARDPKAIKQREEGGFIIYTISTPKNPGNSANEGSIYAELGEIYIGKSSGNQYLKVHKGTDWVYVKNNEEENYPIIEKSAMIGGRRRRRRGTKRTKRRSHKHRK